MARNRQNRNEEQHRSSPLVSMAANLVGNAFVRTRIPELRFLAKKVEELKVSTGTLVLFQSGLETLIEESNLPQSVEIIVEEVLDKIFYGLRALPVDADDKAQQLALHAGGQTMLSFMKDKFKKEPEQRGSRFPMHEAGLDAADRKTLFDWDKKLRNADDKAGLKQWMFYRDRVESKERLAYLISLDEADRLPYLESIYGKAPADGAEKPKPGALGVLKGVKDTLEGKAGAASADIEARIATATTDVEAFGDEQKAKAIDIRAKNKLPEWLVPALFVAAILACVVGLVVLNNLIK